MKIDLSPDEVTALMLRLPAEARDGGSFIYAEPDLTIPSGWADAATAVMGEDGWREIPVAAPLTPVEKLAAFLSANPDVAALIG
jgi:hypothetical protein